MPLKFHWFLPTQGDGRGLIETGEAPPAGVAGGLREASIAYLTRVATAAEDLGFEAALTPTGAWCEDAWLTTAMLAPLSERLKFLVAFRPGLVSPFLAAQMAGTDKTAKSACVAVNHAACASFSSASSEHVA